MLVSREIIDPVLARFVQNASEEQLCAAMEEIVADAELVDAIQHSLTADNPEDRLSARSFLASIHYEDN